MNDKELVELRIPGVGHAIAAAPNMGWPAEGVAIWPEHAGGGRAVGIRHFHSTRDVSRAEFGCTTCGWGSQPWSAWVSLARRILAVDDALKEKSAATTIE